MKIQYLAIIFVIIILPISIVISSYIQSQIETISLQTQFNIKLQTATSDAIKSFQLNTINNKYSTISDSKIRDIEASISTFYNSLGTELGASGYSRDELKEYIPAILYTMYDGYYIYGEYWNETLEGDDKYQYGLRPYIYYSCRYKTENDDFVINYTLDNNITIYGIIDNQYVTKSGALINPKLVDSIDEKPYEYVDSKGNKNSGKYVVSVKYDGITIGTEILKEQLILLDADNNPEDPNGPVEYEYVTYNNRKVYKEKDKEEYFWNNKNTKQYIKDEETLNFVKELMTIDGHLRSNSAAQYYADAYNFSKWVDEKLGGITQENAYEADGTTKITNFAINTQDSKIFALDNNNNPLISSSVFNQNRTSVIRKSIESNLATAIANFGSTSEYEFVMPIFTEEDWDKLVNNISVAAFMQGIPIGAKYYNNYYVIANDKNKEVVTTDSIYVLTEDGEVHLSTCKDMIDNKKTVISAYKNIDFERQNVVITEENERYYYPHANAKCYNCMVSIAEIYDIDDLIAGTIRSYNANTDEYEKNNEATRNLTDTNLRKIYLTALAREKYDLYRTNSYFGM